ncbi:phosphodiester glycosidase family protein [Duganella callida]|uniref:Phosphodiester glycosidase family protein n=1 Tax=Duganella callida TaxID=2561932 RepID=A0A4Y9SN25_9BURK|nr:phosphodiester glycosidase family protein [Duganella callida]TFW26537.1 phosphodiester glycosidase family protein [Duganella callida]
MRNFTKALVLALMLMPLSQIAQAINKDRAITSLGMDFDENVTQVNSANLTVHTFSPKSDALRNGMHYVFIETNCPKCSPQIRVVKQFGNSYDIYRNATPMSAVVAINGSFFGYDAKGQRIPLGLVVADGVRKNRPIGWDRGGFLVHDKKGNTRIIPVHNYKPSINDFSVLQSKPLLVESGKNGIYKDDGERFNRTAVAISTSGKVIIAGAFEGFGRAASLYEFAQFLLSIKCSDGSTIKWALSMDGGPGAQIYVPAIKRNFGDPGQNYVPNLIYVQ